MVETFVEGREVTVGVVGNLVGPGCPSFAHATPQLRVFNLVLRFFPPMEVDLQPYLSSDGVYSNRLKVALADQLNYICPAPLDDEVVDELNWLAAAVFRVTGALDVARVDFRLDANDDNKPLYIGDQSFAGAVSQDF